MKTIFNLSFDIPEKIKGTEKNNSFTRKELVKHLIKSGVIDCQNTFTIYHNNVPIDNVVIAYLVKTTMIFSSYKDSNEIARVLSVFSNNLYYVLTEVKEEPYSYFARIIEDKELQKGFNEELITVLEELRNEY